MAATKQMYEVELDDVEEKVDNVYMHLYKGTGDRTKRKYYNSPSPNKRKSEYLKQSGNKNKYLKNTQSSTMKKQKIETKSLNPIVSQFYIILTKNK